MRGSDAVMHILERAMRGSSADETEALYLGNDTHLTRFANNYVHQNVSETNARLVVRTVVDGRVGTASTNDLAPESVKRTLQTATNAALAQEPSSTFPGLAPSAAASEPDVYDEATANLSAAERAEAAGVLCERANTAGFSAAGTYANGAVDMGYANSNDQRLFYKRTEAEVSTVYQGPTASGYADRRGTRTADLDVESVAQEALDRTQSAQNPQDIEPGTYEVLLDPYAVHDVANFMATLGFGARAVQEGRSFMAGRMGEPVMSPEITFWDDGSDPAGYAAPFDYEGTPKRRVELVTNGVAQGVVYDRSTAHNDHTESTGHAVPPGGTSGPLPLNLFLAPGQKSHNELLAGIERGVLVTRFWYTRTVHPLSVLITGMTRDGTYLIEDGRVTKPVRNLRFTTSYLEALNDVRGVGRDTFLGAGRLGGTRVPALHLGSFNFTGVTEF